MIRQLNKRERELVRISFDGTQYPIYKACKDAFTPRSAHLNGIDIEAEDVFCAVASLLDTLIDQPEITQNDVDNLWTEIYKDIRKKKPDATEHDKQQVAHTVFAIVQKMMCHHWKTRYCDTIFEMLGQTIQKETAGMDRDELLKFQNVLYEYSDEFDEWINQYEERNLRLSCAIQKALDTQNAEDDFVPTGKTFTKSAMITDIQIDIIAQRLAKANKLKASPDDFRKLFSGVDSQFTMTWLGYPGELRDFFKMLTDIRKGKFAYVTPKRGYQQILRSHFVDSGGNYFGELDGQKSIKAFKPIIDDCEFFIQYLTDRVTDVMKELIQNNRDALEESGFFVGTTSAKQEGLRIKKKLR